MFRLLYNDNTDVSSDLQKEPNIGIFQVLNDGGDSDEHNFDDSNDDELIINIMIVMAAWLK